MQVLRSFWYRIHWFKDTPIEFHRDTAPKTVCKDEAVADLRRDVGPIDLRRDAMLDASGVRRACGTSRDGRISALRSLRLRMR